MKKLLVAVLLLFVLFIILIFVLIPGKIIITESKVVGTTSTGFDSCLHNLAKWKQWWPPQPAVSSSDSSFVYDKYTFKPSAMYTDGGTISIQSTDLLLETRIQTIPLNRDSITIEWGIAIETGNNPFSRLSRYLDAGKLKKSVHVIFDSLCSFAGNTQNIYGFPIKRTTFTEVILIADRFTSPAYPTTASIYATVSKLRQYIASLGATEKYYPMMNTKQVDSSTYETMVAISIDKLIPASDEFFISRMVPMQDRFLATEVTGDQTTINKAHNAVEKYMRDHALSAPAIPFEILVTDRSRENDSTKWKSLLFYPSM